MKVAFELTGEMPLLMHSDDVEAADELVEWRNDPKNKSVSVKGDDRSPPFTWQTYLYSDGEHVTIPADNLMTNLRTAGQRMPKSGAGPRSFKELSQTGMYAEPEYLDFSYSDGCKLAVADLAAIRDASFKEQADAVRDMGFRLFVKRAKVGANKHVRVRARFDSWKLKGAVVVTDKVITLGVLGTMFEVGGPGGLCDWRTFCPVGGVVGRFGQYSAKLKKVA